MTEEDVLREVQQLKAGMITFNEKMANLRYDDFHRGLYRRFRTVKARVAGQLCELVEAPAN